MNLVSAVPRDLMMAHDLQKLLFEPTFLAAVVELFKRVNLTIVWFSQQTKVGSVTPHVTEDTMRVTLLICPFMS